jgi:cardiolipin synthase
VNDIWRDLLHLRADVTLAIGLALAIAVTIHALLTKREVASAVGWIGLVWFAPILGAIGYLMFGVNRVRRRARLMIPPGPPTFRPTHGDGFDPVSGLAQLERSLGRITGRPLAPATAVQVYHDGDQAYPPMLEAIVGASRSIGLSTYIFRDDIWGGRFIDALIDAHRRGVAVRVLVDGVGGGWVLSPAYRRLCRSGVPAARFMHSLLPWRMPFVNLRSHKKILVIDGIAGFTGGMNIADENVMATRPREPVQDMHFRLEGPIVSQLVMAFLDDWAFATDEELGAEAWLPQLAPRPGVPARVIDAGPDEDIEKVEFALLQAVTCARSSIAVMTPYFLPEERLITALSLAAMRGVDVDIVIPAQSNHRLVDWATRPNVAPLLDNGVRIWRCPPPFHHTKLMVVDGEWCLIGSSNWDIRSLRLNFELCVELYDAGLASALGEALVQGRGAPLTKGDLDARILPVRLRDAAARLMLPYL